MTPIELRDMRHRLGWSQAKLGDELGVTRFTICRWEAGTWPINRTAIALLAHLDLQIGETQ